MQYHVLLQLQESNLSCSLRFVLLLMCKSSNSKSAGHDFQFQFPPLKHSNYLHCETNIDPCTALVRIVDASVKIIFLFIAINSLSINALVGHPNNTYSFKNI